MNKTDFVDFEHWLAYYRETYEVNAFEYEFFCAASILIFIEETKPSVGSI